MRILLGIIFSSLIFSSFGQIADAPKVKEGEGPYNQLIIRGVTLINGNGAPPIGPVQRVAAQLQIGGKGQDQCVLPQFRDHGWLPFNCAATRTGAQA